jgi:hypothetical protein
MDNSILIEKIESRILQVRGKKVMLDKDLAILYGVKPIALRQQVKRNSDRFPEDFMFQLTKAEANYLVSQNVIPSIMSLGGYLPYVFTQEGVAMLSSVLHSKKAVIVNIHIMRVFVKLRRVGLTYAVLKRKIEEMESKYDKQFSVIFDIFKELIEPAPKTSQSKRQIGFHKD